MGQESIEIIHMSKQYSASATPAVNDLCLGIPKNQIFGLLGTNGAGKTSTMKILTGDILPTSGAAFIRGYNVATQLSEVRKELGYCPQFDPILEWLTAREHLHIFARLRGLPLDQVSASVDHMIKLVGLTEGADKAAGSYSGGMKRKLSLGLALIGDPSVVFLDEPSSGMDPLSRRLLWRVLSETQQRTEAAVVLTTHSMEECEAVCHRVGVMVLGRMRGLGSIQHLKNRFGGGYYLELKFTDGALEDIKSFMTTNFPGSLLEDLDSTHAKYKLASCLASSSVAVVFETVETSKKQLRVEDYSVSQATLEQAFIAMVKKYDPDAANRAE